MSMRLIQTVAFLCLAATLAAEPERIVTKKGDTTIVQVVDEEGWISRETYDAGMCLVKWESPDARKVLLDYDRRLRLARVTMPDGGAILIIRPDNGPGHGICLDADGRERARLKLDESAAKARWLSPKTGKPVDEPEWPRTIPNLDFFLEKAAANREKPGDNEATEIDIYEYDDPGRPTKVEEK